MKRKGLDKGWQSCEYCQCIIPEGANAECSDASCELVMDFDEYDEDNGEFDNSEDEEEDSSDAKW